ncbi:hypothetical protein D918_05804 [Trichuris suis]|nr:hypothetical protein D918_05804 [Trichuris suis]
MEVFNQLESRITRLERLLQRDKEDNDPEKAASLVQSIEEIRERVSQATTAHESINKSMEQLQNPLLSVTRKPSAQNVLSTNAKMHFIKILADKMENMAHQLEAVQKMAPVLDSEHIRNATSMTSQANSLAADQRAIEMDIREFCSEAEQVQRNYMAFVNVMSRCFVHWDDRISKLEESMLSPREE